MNTVRHDSDSVIQVSIKDISACQGALELYDGVLRTLRPAVGVWHLRFYLNYSVANKI